MEDVRFISYDPRFEELIDTGQKAEVLGEGYGWSEGPVWDVVGSRLLFTDVPGNRMHVWDKAKGVQVYMEPSGYTGVMEFGVGQGANGLTFDAKGQLVMCEHGDRRVSVLTKFGGKMTIADRCDGKRFNSPNDLVITSDGSIYFTDPPYGLKGREESPDYQSGFNGVYRILPNGDVTAEVKNLKRPNGIAASVDEKTIYVGHSHGEEPYVLAYPRNDDGSLGEGRVFFDCTELKDNGPGSVDGLKVDEKGNIWTTGPGGVVVIDPTGKKLGALVLNSRAANLCFGEDGHALFLTAHNHLLKLRTKVKGSGF